MRPKLFLNAREIKDVCKDMYKLNSARILPILDIEEVFNSKFIEFGDILSLKGQSTRKVGMLWPL